MSSREPVEKQVKFNKCFKEANETHKRYRMLRGSAGSGKSVNIAKDYILFLSDPKNKGANLLALRKSLEANRDSTFAELQAAVFDIFGESWPAFWAIRKSPMSFESYVTGNQIIFRGMNDARQREKVKSITFKVGKLTHIWCEEITEFLESDIEILDDRLRGQLENPNLYYQLTGTFNPISAAHWLKKKYFDTPSDDVFTHKSTYLDNKYIDEAYHTRMMRRKEEDPEGYMVYGLGEWGETGGLILTNWDSYEFETGCEFFDTKYMGQDFGFNHANCILEIGWKDGEIYVCKELYKRELTTSDIIEQADGKFSKDITMWCDSAEPDRILEWKRAGYNAKPVKKTVLPDKNKAKAQSLYGYINSQINWLKTKKIHIHPSCINTLNEIQQWKWRKDIKTGLYVDEPVSINDDAMAALRYGVESIRTQRVSILDVL